MDDYHYAIKLEKHKHFFALMFFKYNHFRIVKACSTLIQRSIMTV